MWFFIVVLGLPFVLMISLAIAAYAFAPAWVRTVSVWAGIAVVLIVTAFFVGTDIAQRQDCIDPGDCDATGLGGAVVAWWTLVGVLALGVLAQFAGLRNRGTYRKARARNGIGRRFVGEAQSDRRPNIR